MSEYHHQQFEGTVHGQLEAEVYRIFESYKIEAQGEHVFMSASGELAWIRFNADGCLGDALLDTTQLTDEVKTIVSLRRTPNGFIASKAYVPFIVNENVPFDESQAHKIVTAPRPQLIDYSDINELERSLGNIDQYYGKLHECNEITQTTNNNDRWVRLYQKAKKVGVIALSSISYVSPYTMMLTAGYFPRPKNF